MIYSHSSCIVFIVWGMCKKSQQANSQGNPVIQPAPTSHNLAEIKQRSIDSLCGQINASKIWQKAQEHINETSS